MAKKFPALRVLVVEDELLIRWSIAETLAHAGHTVIELHYVSFGIDRVIFG